MITAGSSRGKCSVPSTGQVVRCPAGAGTVGVPHCGQCVCVSCQFASATACVSSPASRSLSSAPACRSAMGFASADPNGCPGSPVSPAAHAEVGDAVVVDAEQEPGALRGLLRRHEDQLKLAVAGRDERLGVMDHEHPGARVGPRRLDPGGVAPALRGAVDGGAGQREPPERPVVKLAGVVGGHASPADVARAGSAETEGMVSQSRGACGKPAALAR